MSGRLSDSNSRGRIDPHAADRRGPAWPTHPPLPRTGCRAHLTEWSQRAAQYLRRMIETGEVDGPGRLSERLRAVENFFEVLNKLVTIEELSWAAVESDPRLLAYNAALRRQFESVQAATVLTQQGLGHLAVSFVRAAVEDVIYLAFFAKLEVAAARELFKLLGVWDSTRSLIAQRAYLGDEVMSRLWYPADFVDRVQVKCDETRVELQRLQRQYRWAGGNVPSAAWLAEQAQRLELYEYLHAATSRAVHFSAGEILRRSWGEQSGSVRTDHAGFREHLAEFALDQLVRLYAETWRIATPALQAAGIRTNQGLTWTDVEPTLNRLLDFAGVPLVHAAEWNLRPQR